MQTARGGIAITPKNITLAFGIVYVVMNPPDTILHLASAALTAYIGFFRWRRPMTA